MVDESNKAILIDLGSQYIKAGFSGAEAPDEIIYSAVGHLKGETYAGEDAKRRSGILNL